jgi:hypothetical protein
MLLVAYTGWRSLPEMATAGPSYAALPSPTHYAGHTINCGVHIAVNGAGHNADQIAASVHRKFVELNDGAFA